MKKHLPAIITLLAMILGIGSRYVPDIEIGPKPTPVPVVPKPVAKTAMWNATKTFLLLQRDARRSIAKDLDEDRITTQPELADAVEKGKKSATAAAYVDVKAEDDKILKPLDLSTEEGRNAARDWQNIRADQFEEAASE